MSKKSYSLAFNTRAALILDTITIAQLYSQFGKWDKVKEIVIEENTLYARTVSTSRRIYSEISNRLKTLNDEEIELLILGTSQDQQQIIWLAICLRYRFIKDFSIEVLSERFDIAQYSLHQEDYEAYYIVRHNGMRI